MLDADAGYWAFAAAAAAAFYGWLSWFGRSHLSPAARDELALWLMGAHEESWARTFCRLFDAAFGARHLSLRCFLRSSIASVAAVAALYLLFGPVLGVLDGRALGELTLWQALLIGAAVNVLPDYISLYETRWLLGRFQRVRSLPGQLAVLAVDAVITGAIIWGGVALFLSLRGEAPPGPVEMMAIFSVYAIFFYSTFLTSAWAWVHCLSLWIMRLFSRTALVRVLDVERNPAAQLGLVGALVIFAGATAASPFLTTEGDRRTTALDRGLCDIFGGRLCLHVVRLTPDQREAYAQLTAFCEENTLVACHDRVLSFYNGDIVRTLSLWRRACDAGAAEGCAYLAAMYRFGRGVAPDPEHASGLYADACALGGGRFCAILGEIFAAGEGVTRDPERAAELFAEGCKLDDARACLGLGRAYGAGLGVERDVVRAASLLEQACGDGSAEACTIRAGALATAADHAHAAEFYQDGCDAGDPAACTALAGMHERGLGVAEDPDRATVLYAAGCMGEIAEACTRFATLVGVPAAPGEVEAGVARKMTLPTSEGDLVVSFPLRKLVEDFRLCDDEDTDACFRLGATFEAGFLVERAPERAAEFYGRACDEDIADGCMRLARMYEEGRGTARDPQKAFALYTRACDIGSINGCLQLSKRSSHPGR